MTAQGTANLQLVQELMMPSPADRLETKARQDRREASDERIQGLIATHGKRKRRDNK
jgi:hypothetical protein